MQLPVPLLLAVGWIALAISPALGDTAPITDRQVVKNVRLSFEEEAPMHSVVIRHGRIEQILPEGSPLPAGVVVIDGMGRIATPAFLDGWSTKGFEPQKPVATQDAPVDVLSDIRTDMRDANRKGIQPSLRAADHLAIGEDAAASWRKAGFGAAMFAQGGELLSGTGVVATTRSAPRRDVIVRADVYPHAAFRASGGGYPSTLMGYHAQLRQFFLDARRHHELTRRYSIGLPDPRPPFDPELEAIAPVLRLEQRLVCEARTHRDISRWIRLSEEFGFEIAIADGREAWRVADELASRNIPVFLSLDWGEEVKDPSPKEKDTSEDTPEGGSDEDDDSPPSDDDPAGDDPDDNDAEDSDRDGDAEEHGSSDDDHTDGPSEDDADEDADENWGYETPIGIRLDQRRSWEERRANALRLHEAGVRFVFGTGGGKPSDLLERVRTLVELGLPAEVAREALTEDAARILGVLGRLGSLAEGADATFAIWTDDPMKEESQLAWMFVDGESHEFEVKEKKWKGDGEGPAEGVDATGTWEISYVAPGSEEGETSTLALTMAEGGAVTGTLTADNPLTGGLYETAITGTVAGTQLDLTAEISFGDFQLTFSVDAVLDGDEFSGELTFSGSFGEQVTEVTGERKPQQEVR